MNNNPYTNKASRKAKYLYLAFSLAAISLGTGFSCDKHGPGGHHDHDHHASSDSGKANLANELAKIGARLEMIEDRRIGSSEVTALPSAAVISEGTRTFVLAQSDQDPAKIVRREVTLGKTDGQWVEAKTGVFPGDNVVVQLQNVASPQPRFSQPAPRSQFNHAQPQYESRPQYNPQPQYGSQPRYNSQPDYGSRPLYNSQPQYGRQSDKAENASPRYSQWNEPSSSSGVGCESRFVANQPDCHGGGGSCASSAGGSCSFDRQPVRGCEGGRCGAGSFQDPYAYGYQPALEGSGCVSEFCPQRAPEYNSHYTPQPQHSNRCNHGSCNH